MLVIIDDTFNNRRTKDKKNFVNLFNSFYDPRYFGHETAIRFGRK